MKKAYTDFLRNLQQELLTQSTDGNRDPTYWGVLVRKRVYGLQEGNCMVTTEDGEGPIGKPNDPQSIMQAICEQHDYLSLEEFDDPADIEDIVGQANDLLGMDTYQVVYYRDEWELAQDAIFLTKKACLEHIACNGHNYLDPKPYAMTAFRCPEYEMLLSILKTVDWLAQVLPNYDLGWLDENTLVMDWDGGRDEDGDPYFWEADYYLDEQSFVYMMVYEDDKFDQQPPEDVRELVEARLKEEAAARKG